MHERMFGCTYAYFGFRRGVLRARRSMLAERTTAGRQPWAVRGIVSDFESAVWTAVKKGKL